MKKPLAASVATVVPVLASLFAWIAIASCASPPAASSASSAVLTSSRVSPGVVARHRVPMAEVGGVALAGELAAPGVLRAGAAVDRMAATEDGRQLLSLLVACALPADLAILTRADGVEVTILGEIGLASGWARHPLGNRDRRWVSACALARMSGTDVAIPISIRGRAAALRAPLAERQTWTLEEGAFFGDLFAGADGPIAWGACGGRDVEVAQAMGRVCAQEDPATPGITRCGLAFVGDCSAACASGRETYGACVISSDLAFDQVVAAFLAP